MVPSRIVLFFIGFVHAADHRSGQRWARTTRSFKLGVIKSVTNSGPNDWLGTWDWAMDTWSQSKVLDLVTVRGETDSQTRLACPPKEGYIRVCNNDYGRTSWRGYARWSFQVYDGRPGLIYQCTVRLNDRTATDYEKKWLGHELGHCLGLDHTSTTGQSDNSVMDYSVAPTSIGPGQIDFDVLESVYSDIDWYDSYSRLDPITCPPSKLAEVAAACSCDGPSPGFAWSNEQEYIVCVDFIVEDTGCNRQDVIDLAKCIPFDLPTASPTKSTPKRPTRSPTQFPTRALTLEPSEIPSAKPARPIDVRSPTGVNPTNPTNEPSDFPTKMPSPIPTTGPTMPSPTDYPTGKPSTSADACSSILLARLAQECSCFGPDENQAWAAEDEYLQCVDFAAMNTPCPVQALIDLAGCLPFPIPTAEPTLLPTMRTDADRRSTPSPSSNAADGTSDASSTHSPTKLPTLGPTKAPTSPPTVVPTRMPTKAPTKVPTISPTKNPTAECSREEFARVSSQCSCDGRKNKKPWKNQREYERCVKIAIERSQCSFQSVMDATRCVVPDRGAKRTKKASTGNNSNAATCGQYNEESGCKTSKGTCKWSKKENRCQTKNNRRNLLLMNVASEEHHHHHLPKEETIEYHNLRASFGQTYNSVTEDSVCQDKVSFGVPAEATLVHSHPNSCRYVIQSGNNVDVIEVLL